MKFQRKLDLEVAVKQRKLSISHAGLRNQEKERLATPAEAEARRKLVISLTAEPGISDDTLGLHIYGKGVGANGSTCRRASIWRSMFSLMQLPPYVLILVLSCCFASMKAQQPGISYHNSWLYSMPWRPLILPTVARLPSLPGASQLSPGYTGPQTFPPVPQDQQQPQNTFQQQQPQNPYQQQQQQQNPYQQQQQQPQNPYQQQQHQQNPFQKEQQQQQYPPQSYQQPLLLGLFTPQLQVHPLAAPPSQPGHFSLPFRPSPFAGYTDDEEENQVVPVVDQGNHQQQQQQQQQQQHQLEEPAFHAHPYKPVAAGSEPSRGPAGGGGYVYLSPSNLYNVVRS